MLILLIRHGNTFGPDQKPFYVGSTDLDLSASGNEQATAIAAAIEKAGIQPTVFTSELKRTQQTMKPCVDRLSLEQTADKRLNELDYGKWEGKSDAEIDELYGSNEPRKKWDKQRIRPEDAGFKPSAAEVSANIDSLADELLKKYSNNDIIVLCSSNGLISEFLRLVPDARERLLAEGALKVATGSISALTIDKDSAKCNVLFWNKKPTEAPLADF